MAPRRPNTSQPVVPVRGQRLGKAHRKHCRRLVQNSVGGALARSRQDLADQPLPDSPVVLRGGWDKPGYRLAAVEHLNLASPADFPDVAREIRLQSGNRHRRHKDQYGLGLQTSHVSNGFLRDTVFFYRVLVERDAEAGLGRHLVKAFPHLEGLGDEVILGDSGKAEPDTDKNGVARVGLDNENSAEWPASTMIGSSGCLLRAGI